jgi:hypothetical protein
MDGRQQEMIHMPGDFNGKIYLQLEYKLTRYAAELRPVSRTKGRGSVRLNGRREKTTMVIVRWSLIVNGQQYLR